MFVIENYMHIEHRHKMYGLHEAAQHRLEQHMEREIYVSMIMVTRNTQKRYHMKRKTLFKH